MDADGQWQCPHGLQMNPADSWPLCIWCNHHHPDSTRGRLMDHLRSRKPWEGGGMRTGHASFRDLADDSRFMKPERAHR